MHTGKKKQKVMKKRKREKKKKIWMCDQYRIRTGIFYAGRRAVVAERPRYQVK